MQHVDRPADVQALSQPARPRRACVNVKPARRVLSVQLVDGIGRHRTRRRNVRNEPAVRPPKLKLTVGVSLHPVALFMHRAVMPTAEQREIRKRRRAAMGPVTDVPGRTGAGIPGTDSRSRDAEVRAVTRAEWLVRRLYTPMFDRLDSLQNARLSSDP